MAYTVSGTLKLPDGTAAAGVDLRFVALTTFSPLIESAEQTVRTGANGSYSIALQVSSYNVFVTYSNNRPFLAGRIVITPSTAIGLDLPTLLGGREPTTPEWIQQVEVWLSQAQGSAAAAASSASSATVEADRAKEAANSINPESGAGQLMRIGGPAILDSERCSLERATGGKQTIIRDSEGNANVMFVLPRFRYEDLGMAADMGSGDVTAFDFGSGSIKSEIFIGAYLASGAGSVSAPKQDPRVSIDHINARAACAAKGDGWHLMTAHEWAAIALWCMANGYEPLGNTNWGRSHAKMWLIGSRSDGRSPGDFSGTGRTKTGSIGQESSHDRALGIYDLVGNVWEWQDGFLLRSGQVVASTYNCQPEVSWVTQAAFFDAPASAPVLAASITRTATTNSKWSAVEKGAGYASNRLLKRLLLEPSTILPQGEMYVNNGGLQFPLRGNSHGSGVSAGLAAVSLSASNSYMAENIGFRASFA